MPIVRICSGVFLALCVLSTTLHADTDQVARQFREFCLQESTDHGQRLLDDVEIPNANQSEIDRYLSSLQPDGSWPDVDYQDRDRSAWRPVDHLTRVLAITVHLCQNETPDADRARSLAAIHSALAFWAQHDFSCPNWWYNQIGVPKLLGITALLLGDDLQNSERNYITQTVMPRVKVGSMTGQNRVWLAANGIMCACLTKDEALLKKGADAIADEIRVTESEGIQPDWSFHQHGHQQQFGNYGGAFAVEMCKWACVLRQTPFAFGDDKLTIIRNYLLHGQNWVTWNGAMDISSCGRQLFPGTQEKKAGAIRGVFRTMVKADPSHAAEYQSFVDRNADRNAADHPNDLIGDQFFWRSDYLLHRRSNWMASVKMSSARVIGGETVNNENLLGLHLADGGMFIYRTGSEYKDIFPVWDWHKIPGTTEAQNNTPLSWSGKAARLKTEFVGGASDGQSGCCALDFKREGLTARKAWFFSGDTIVCLGAGITSKGDVPVLTTVNQCLTQGPIKSSDDGNATDGFGWIEHAGVRYGSLTGPSILFSNQEQTGEWTRVFHNPSAPKKAVSAKVLTLTISHGSNPAGASYAYSVSPAETPMPKIKIVVNDDKQQAIKIGTSYWGVIFWLPGSVKIDDKIVSVDNPCILLCDGGHLTVADPTQKLKSINIQQQGRDQRIDLPQGPEAGSSMHVPE